MIKSDFSTFSRIVNCKINIGLHVIRRRSDGYHDIETILYPTDCYSDILTLSPCRESFVFDCNYGTRREAEDNLCVKAFRLLQKDYPVQGVKIQLEKRIPVGAGLGGGSADAAFTLKMLSEAFNLALTDTQLLKYATQLGSDVPFFILNRPVFATGRGEQLKPVDLDLSAYRIVIRKPDFSVSTREAYHDIVPRANRPYLPDIVQKSVETWKDTLTNDFEESLFRRYPTLMDIKNDFYVHHALYAAMSGSGSAIFGIFRK